VVKIDDVSRAYGEAKAGLGPPFLIEQDSRLLIRFTIVLSNPAVYWTTLF